MLEIGGRCTCVGRGWVRLSNTCDSIELICYDHNRSDKFYHAILSSVLLIVTMIVVVLLSCHHCYYYVIMITIVIVIRILLLILSLLSFDANGVSGSCRSISSNAITQRRSAETPVCKDG